MNGPWMLGRGCEGCPLAGDISGWCHPPTKGPPRFLPPPPPIPPALLSPVNLPTQPSRRYLSWLGGGYRRGVLRPTPPPPHPQALHPCLAPHHVVGAALRPRADLSRGRGVKWEQMPPRHQWAQPQPISHACNAAHLSAIQLRSHGYTERTGLYIPISRYPMHI